MAELLVSAHALGHLALLMVFRMMGFAVTLAGAATGLRLMESAATGRSYAVADGLRALLVITGGAALLWMSGTIVAAVVGAVSSGSAGSGLGARAGALHALIAQMCISFASVGMAWQALTLVVDVMFDGSAGWAQVGPRLVWMGLALAVCIAAPAIVAALQSAIRTLAGAG